MEKNFIKVHTSSDITISAILVLGGSALAFLSGSDALAITGVFCIIAGIVLFFVLKSGYRENGSSETYRKKTLNFSQSEKKVLMGIIAKPQDFNGTLNENGSSLMLTIYHNKKDAYLQLFEYIPYSYVACTEMYHYNRSDVNALLR